MSKRLSIKLSIGCNFNVLSNNFNRNSAKLKGGAIYYDLYSPIGITSNNFTLNRALYGKDIASYPLKLKMNSLHSSAFDFFNIPSGFNFDGPLQFGLYD
jgi:hypothetical protein